MKLALGKIAEFTGADGSFNRAAVAQGYSIDSRTLKPGDLFFAIKGERLDGHDFVEKALAAGASAAVICRDRRAGFNQHHEQQLLMVNDPLLALQELASGVRNIWGKRLIGVTGSAGKTTTKEAIATVLSTKFSVLKSEGNLNNQFGLPLQLLRLEMFHDLAVLEMGMSHAGEIRALAEIAQPNIGVVTCVAPVHLGYFNSVAEIARAKYELIEGLPADGVAVLNADDGYVSQFGRDFQGKVVTFGIRHPADLRAGNIHQSGAEGSTFDVIAHDAALPASLRLIGEHNIYNALAAVAVALECGMSVEAAAAALPLLTPSDKRGEILNMGGATVINDCYNSNPRALDSMVNALAAMETGKRAGVSRAGRRIVVAGEMLELGPAAEKLHQQSGRHMAERGIDVLIGVRGAARAMVDAAKDAGMAATFMDSPEQAGEWLAREVRPGDVILLKASRGVRLEHALETWKHRAESVPLKERTAAE